MESHTILIDEAMVAKQLDCEVKTLQAWRCRGVGPSFVKIGRLVRYRQSDVQAWIASRTVRSTSELPSRGEV